MNKIQHQTEVLLKFSPGKWTRNQYLASNPNTVRTISKSLEQLDLHFKVAFKYVCGYVCGYQPFLITG